MHRNTSRFTAPRRRHRLLAVLGATLLAGLVPGVAAFASGGNAAPSPGQAVAARPASSGVRGAIADQKPVGAQVPDPSKNAPALPEVAVVKPVPDYTDAEIDAMVNPSHDPNVSWRRTGDGKVQVRMGIPGPKGAQEVPSPSGHLDPQPSEPGGRQVHR